MDYKIAWQCATLSQEVYQDFSDITFREWPGGTPTLIDTQDATDTQLAILEDAEKKIAVIVFRGSQGEKDWETNLQLSQSEYQWSKEEKKAYKTQMKQVSESVSKQEELVYPDKYSQSQNPVKMHRGFVRAYLSVRERIHDHVKNSGATQYRITGHSLGGAIAKLCAIDLQYNFSDKISVEAYSFGSPRVGNKAFTESYNRRVPDTWRVVNGWDAVVGLPVPWQGYRHVDKPLKMARRVTWRILFGSFEDHRISSYIKELRSRM